MSALPATLWCQLEENRKLQVRGISTENRRKEKRMESGIEKEGREGKTPLHFVTHSFLFL
jgi:hypothetical protein